MMLASLLTTLVSSAILGVRLAVGYWGLVVVMARRGVKALLHPRSTYLVSEESTGLDLRNPSFINCSTATEKELTAAVASLKAKVMSRDVGRRRRARASVGTMRVDYGTLLRTPKMQEDYFGS
ncbi:hypothetical protein P167DRAFT_532431 [Morchella conica CCBAS932]|uniref:Uncharacterized protein n=2 Tax=Morchella sect. Distantes TaxID=1051054 RepID=A0A3N4LER1_9PEZI|nr:hypothetical protein P167DRAFT_532431 [Morchella conica CCBAS932]